ncbi:hypothetical protein FHR83_003784 [Actinoplanes campanulatus]|uniref:Uncharacterized protein n=1 Tax=Actinoplanes campanulatus TaxID=113559 RepID=A0A7W5FF44_9ACTN|nr:hypothetical protein [Actinoplanes campanulatus]
MIIGVSTPTGYFAADLATRAAAGDARLYCRIICSPL